VCSRQRVPGGALQEAVAFVPLPGPSTGPGRFKSIFRAVFCGYLRGRRAFSARHPLRPAGRMPAVAQHRTAHHSSVRWLSGFKTRHDTRQKEDARRPFCGMDEGQYCCPECPHRLSTRRGIRSHLRAKHAAPAANKKHAIEKLSGDYRCTVCGIQSPSYKQALRHEREQHSDVTLIPDTPSQTRAKRVRREELAKSGATLAAALAGLAQNVFRRAFERAHREGVCVLYGSGHDDQSCSGECDGADGLCRMRLSGLWYLESGQLRYCVNCAMARDWPPGCTVGTAVPMGTWSALMKTDPSPIRHTSRRVAAIQQWSRQFSTQWTTQWSRHAQWRHHPDRGITSKSSGLGERTSFSRKSGTEARIPGEVFDEAKRAVVGRIMRRVERIYNPTGGLFSKPTSEQNCGLALFTHGEVGVTHMHVDRGAADNVMLYGQEAFWVCVDSRHLTVQEMAAVVKYEHEQPAASTQAEVVRLVEGLQRLVANQGAVYWVRQQPGQLVTVPPGVLHAVHTVTSKDLWGACKFAFDYPPTVDLTGYYQDRDKLVAVAANLRALNLPGWAVPAEDCVNLDGWLVAAIRALALLLTPSDAAAKH
jgi:hypothetical protein